MIGSARASGGEHRVGIEEIRRLITTHAHKEDLGLPGVLINKITDPTRPTPAIAEPILAFSMQGAKRIALADSVYDQVPGTFLTVAVDLPITGHYVQASRAEPYLGFALELRSWSIAELLIEAASSLPGIHASPPPGISIDPGRASRTPDRPPGQQPDVHRPSHPAPAFQRLRTDPG
jgi:hypothetical protein